MARRGIGRAHEQAPSARAGSWANRNTLVFIAAGVAAVALWFAINWVADDLINFLIDDENRAPVNPNAPAWIITKLIAAGLAIFAILKSQLK
jgi:hypothetical protein